MSKQPKGKKLSVPRSYEEAQKEFNQRAYEAGQTQYQIAILSEQLKNLNDRMQAISQEAAARKKLDDLAKQQQEETGATNAQ